MTGPTDPRDAPEPGSDLTPGRDKDFRPDDEMENVPRRSRQPVIAAAALLGILLLVLAIGIFGGIF